MLTKVTKDPLQTKELLFVCVMTGGARLLNVRPTIPVVDLSSWIQTYTSKDDYVILKLDVEGAEYDILKKMLVDGTFEWIDKYV